MKAPVLLVRESRGNFVVALLFDYNIASGINKDIFFSLFHMNKSFAK